jgi:hypothetical protein
MLAVDFSILNQKATPAIYADTLANRPAASFAGRLFVDTASPYGIYRDTGSAWVQIAGGGGGGTSTGVNGLNGTTNIGLGGTLANNTTIAGNDKQFSILNTNLLTLQSTNSSLISFIQLYENKIYLQSTNSLTTTQFGIITDKINSQFGTGLYGLLLDDTTGKFALGDYGNDRKYNSIVVNDDSSTFYFTTSYNQANTDQDLFYASNASSGSRFVKIGDFNNYLNGTYLIVDDANNNISTYGSVGAGGISLNFATDFYLFGSNNCEIQCDNSSQSITLSTPSIILSVTPEIQTGTITNTASATIPTNYLSIKINGNNYKILLFNP